MSARTHPPVKQGYADDFVADVLDDAKAHDSRVYAIAGLQGTGKSTLSAQIAKFAGNPSKSGRGLHVAALSIDNFYLGKRERQRLARDVHPLLATRGPPGTHDVALACEVIDALREGRATKLPRFDKIADQRLPSSRWPVLHAVDLVLFEGWFLKVPAQTPTELVAPINALERDEDRDGSWRRWCNTALANDYPSLWQRLPRMLVLRGPGFEIVPEWRWQQEQTLQAANPGRAAMTRSQVEHFVQFFERVSRQALRTWPDIAATTIRLDAQRRPLSRLTAPRS